MVYSAINRIETSLTINSLNETTFNNPQDNSLQIKLNISMSLAFWCGIFQVIYF